MAKIRVHELAKELGQKAKDVGDLLVSWGFEDKRHAVSVLEDDQVARLRQHYGAADGGAAKPAKAKAEPKAEAKKTDAEKKAEPAKAKVEAKAEPKTDVQAEAKADGDKKPEAAKAKSRVAAPMMARSAQPMKPLAPQPAAEPPAKQPAAKGGHQPPKAPQFKQVTRATAAQEQAIRQAEEAKKAEAERLAEEARMAELIKLAQLHREAEAAKAAEAARQAALQPAAPKLSPVAPPRPQQPQPGPAAAPAQPGPFQQPAAVASATAAQPTVSYPRPVGQPGARTFEGPAAPAGPGFAGAPGGPAAPGGPGAPGAGDRRRKDEERLDKVAPRPGGGGGRNKKHRGRGPQTDGGGRREDRNAAPTTPAGRTVRITPGMTVKELADQLGVRETEVIKKLFLKGILATINQSLQTETAEMIATDYEAIVEIPSPEEEDQLAIKAATDGEDPSLLQTRPPVVTIMGHVDHGKTSLLDAIRKTRVTEGEAGGITQHIGAYQVEVDGRLVTFLDTPGHEAFTAMRARGANATDIVILVVAADDGIMPQTIEAINHAKAAKVPIIVAVNKIDKAGADVERAKTGLTEHGLVPEEWGGDTVVVPVSAKQRIGLTDLLEMVLLVADMGELKANPDKLAQGVIIESQLSRGKGAVATVLVQGGTLEVGDNFVAGATHGKVRAMLNERGKRLKKATPSTPVEISGFNGVPAAGDVFRVTATEKEAREIAERRRQERDAAMAKPIRHVSLDNIYSQIQEGKLKELNVVIKADVAGSMEALQQSLTDLQVAGVSVRVIHTGTGDVSENDVLLAAASDALVIAFNVKADANARAKAEQENVDIRQYQIIYKVIDDVKAALEGMLEPEMEEVVTAKADVRQVFKVGKTVQIAGLYITEGKLHRSNSIRVLRGGEVLHTGKVDSLKRFKDDVREVAAGYECGLSLEKWNDFQEGDTIEAFTQQAKQRA